MADANDPRLVGQTLAPPAVYRPPKGESCTRSLPCVYPTHLPYRLPGEWLESRSNEPFTRPLQCSPTSSRRTRSICPFPSASGPGEPGTESCVISPDSCNHPHGGGGFLSRMWGLACVSLLLLSAITTQVAENEAAC